MKANLIERLRAHAEGRHGLRMQITGAEKIVALLTEKNDLLREAAAALEAEASEGERRGLERAAARVQQMQNLFKGKRDRAGLKALPRLQTQVQVLGDAAAAVRALIPEAPAS